jgi:hypothetical protein
LLVSLLAKANDSAEQPLGDRYTFDAPLRVLHGGEIEKDGGEVRIDDALAVSWRVVDGDRRPEHLSVCDVVGGTKVREDDLHNHVGAQLANARTADAWELLRDAVGDRISQGLFAVGPILESEPISIVGSWPPPSRAFFV